MDEAAKTYDPLSYSRNGVSTQADKREGGIGKMPEKNPTPTLRIFGSNLGNQYVCYGTTGGGTQDYTPPRGENQPPGCNWFWFYYTGLMVIDGDAVLGHWRIRVDGEGLDMVAYEVGKHVKPTMFVGEKTTGINSITIKSIIIEPYKPKKLKIVKGQLDEGFQPDC